MDQAPLGLLDYHIHSKLCGHGVGELEEYVRYAVQTGLPEMGFSEHIFLYWLPEHLRDPELAMSEAQFVPYLREVERLQVAYPETRLKLALEADFIVGHEAELRRVLQGYQWDYLIGSVHFIDGWGVDDERYRDGFDAWDIDELYECYFDHVCRAAETGIYQVMGHLDLVKKFGHRPTRSVAELYRRTARRLKVADVCIEVNTSGLRKPCAEMYPHPKLVKACFEAGVPVTLGSDAHQPDRVGDAALQAVAMLRDIGYTHITRFTGQRRESVALP
ncbi:MAG: histidinol-phosphatase HisJ family protein [Chloroflexota bacterium]